MRILGISALMAMMCVALVGCGEDGPRYVIPSQKWRDITVRIESRPAPPVAGMNEFWVILNDARGIPVPNAVVSVRAASATWSQAIQDGHTGVYRRAIRVEDPIRQPLVVQLRVGKEQAELTFGLDVEPQLNDQS